MKIAASAEKIKQTKLEKYGDACWNNAEKARRTCIEKYGVEYTTQTDLMKAKSRQTCMRRYGVENGGGSAQARKKIKESNIKRLGVEYPMQNAEVKSKAKNTFIEKYGVTTPFKLERVKRMNGDRAKTASYEKYIKNCEFDEPVFSLNEYLNSGRNEKLQFRCRKCGNTFSSIHDSGRHGRCPECYPAFRGTSGEEHELADFIKANTMYEVLENVRDVISPLELDIYVPGKKLAIEFDGLYWHCVGKKDRKYHLAKTEMCEKAGIRLIHVFENEWLYGKDIVKSRLLNALGVCVRTLFARKCVIAEMSPEDARLFVDANHTQGYVNSSINIGLFSDEEPVSVMCFSKNRFSGAYEYEMTRFCSKLGFRVVGGAGKLLAYFERMYTPKSLVSYADRRWSSGNLYERLGFKFIRNSPPNYWYFRGQSLVLESRVKYQKHRLAGVLEKFDPEKTEMQNMTDNGYYAIYDCGNKVYAKEY